MSSDGGDGPREDDTNVGEFADLPTDAGQKVWEFNVARKAGMEILSNTRIIRDYLFEVVDLLRGIRQDMALDRSARVERAGGATPMRKRSSSDGP